MGCISCSQGSRVEPENPDTENVVDDEVDYVVTKRSCTDIPFLLIMIAFVIVLIGFLAYCMYFGDIYRIINGYDDCGNVCGRKNKQYNELGCSGADHTESKYLLVNPSTSLAEPHLVHRICVQSCENQGSFVNYLNRCLPIRTSENIKNSYFSKTGIKNFFQEVSEDLENCWEEILYLCIISFVLSIILVIALRFIVGFIIWLVLIGIVVALICGTIFLWVEYAYPSGEESEEIMSERREWLLAFAILITIATLCICLIIFALRKRIDLVVQLFQEAGKSLINMPLLLFEPILTFVALSFFTSLWLYFAINIQSSGRAESENNQSIQYVKDTTMMVSRWYNLLALFWFVNFVIGCQHIIIAGAVAKWFFTRDKNKLSSPILNSFRNLIFYHLGTIALGSFLLALINLIRTLIKWIMMTSRGPQNRFINFSVKLCQCCLYIFENFLQYLNRNAYIETAITGQSFCSSAKRAFHLLSTNALRVIAINSVGDFVLLLMKGFVILITVLIGIELIHKKEKVHHSWVPLTIAGLFSYLVVHCFISVYEMTIDTIFICFCEDCEQNDGINKPYFMSRNLMEYVKNSKKVILGSAEGSTKAW